MRKQLRIFYFGFLLLALLVTLSLVGACAKEAAPDTSPATDSAELTAAQAEVASLTAAKADLTAQVAELGTSLEASAKLNQELSAISAYGIWFDNYYGSGIYDFEDFNTQLGSLVTATGDANSIAAFNVYYEADQAYAAILASLPQDDSAWTMAQYESWRDSGQARTQALGQIGGHLMNVLKDITWFEVN